MGLDVPDLDDRSYAEILEDARKRIPVYSEEWTDHNAHDPGITILELLAWLAETYGYQLDRVTDAHVEKYLALMGARPRPPTPASVDLSVEVTEALDGRRIPAGEHVAVVGGSGTEAVFETAEPVTLTRASVERVVSAHRDGRTDNSDANRTDGMHFLAFGREAEVGSAMYVGFGDDPLAGADRLDLTVDFHDDDLPEPASHGEEEPAFEPSVGVTWQYLTDYEHWYRDDAWAEFEVERDETNGFYRGGTVTLRNPGADGGDGEWAPDDWGVDDPGARVLDGDEGTYWIRCEVVAEPGRTTGTATYPPGPDPCTDPSTDGTPDPGYEVPPQLDALKPNVVTARHRSTVRAGPLRRPDDDDGEGTTARPGQTFVFARRDGTGVARPVLDVSVGDETGTLLVGDTAWEEVDGFEEWTEVADFERWTEVEDFDASGPDDRHFVLDRSRGAVEFGDGIRGRVPDPEQTVVAETYVHGGGTAGNVPPSSWRFVGSGEGDGEEIRTLREALQGVRVVSEAAAEGGTDAESIDEALSRLKRDLATPYRAVTTDDHRYVATHTPGLRFGRATAVVRPAEDADDAEDAGGGASRDEVGVVVVPFSPLDRPEPSRGFLDAVRCHLEEHSLVTERVTVEPPTYVGIGVEAEVGVAPGYVEGRRATAVAEALDAFLDPLSGFDGDGWPFGRPVYTSELYETIEDVEGVDCVRDLSVAARGERTIDGDGTVRIDDTGLVYSMDHDVIVRTGPDRCGGDL